MAPSIIRSRCWWQFSRFPTIILGFAMIAVVVQASDEVLSIHGSGSSNPGHCFGNVMDEIQSRAKLPVRLTYRSVGSPIGLEEFINGHDPQKSATDFGSGEIPVPTRDWQQFQQNNVTILQLPTLFGAVSFFHSLPDIFNLNLTSCLLARIFMRDIKDWAHADILAFNPGLSEYFEDQTDEINHLGGSMRIRVCVREEGAGNSKAIAEYIYNACPEHFPADMVSDLPNWPSDTEPCIGTVGMNECIESRPGTIGYNEAGIALFAGLKEVALENKYGRVLTSQLAAANGGIGAFEPGILPDNPTDDFGSVFLLDQDGEYSWPITLLTYVYIRADLSFKQNKAEMGLLLAFLKALYDPSYVSICEEKQGFALPVGPSLEIARKGIALLESRLGPDVPKWALQSKAEAITGAGDYVLSANRRNYPDIERNNNLQNIDLLKAEVAELKATIAQLTIVVQQSANTRVNHEAEFTENYEAMIMAAVIMSSISIAFILAFAVAHLSSRCYCVSDKR